MFVSVNEFDKFGYDYCLVKSIRETASGLVLELEALIVRARNSQNTNYTDSYADTTTLVLEKTSIESMIREGYRRYDANDKLIEEVPDEVVAKDTWKKFFDKNESVFLIEFSASGHDGHEGQGENTGYEGFMVFEMPAEIGDNPETFEMKVSFAKAEFSWERYMNRVQN